MNTRTRLIALAAALSLAAPLASCSAVRSTIAEGQEFAADLLIPVSEEVKLGQQISTEIEQGVTIHADPQVQAWANAMGTKLVQAAGKDVSSGITFKFQVIDDPDTVNAMALPGGWVYIYSGLLLVSDTEAEVAAVLGHEVAHVTRRHIAERLVTIYGIDALQQVVANQGGGALTSIISDVAANGYLLKYSRDHETDADLTGLTYLIRAGYDPNGFISFFKKLEGTSSSPEFLSSHPDPSNRIEAIRERLKGRDDLPTYTGSDALTQLKSRL